MLKKLISTIFKIIKIILFILLLLITIIILINTFRKPSNDRLWNNDQKISAIAQMEGEYINIKNIRNFSYSSTTEYKEQYYDKSFKIKDLKSVWYFVEPFHGIPGSAHTFLSFEFEDENKKKDFVSISVEIRKEKGESFHPIKGLFAEYELMYVIADEKDVVELRTNYRKNQVYMYPVKASKETVKNLFIDMLNRNNKLANYPEFYNTITNTCTTNIVKHVNKLLDDKLSKFDLSVLFPEYSDELALEMGLIDTDLNNIEDIRKKFNINEKANKFKGKEDFSLGLRGY